MADFSAKSYQVVTNPPYRIATKFIRCALSAVEALLLKADFLNAQERQALIRGIG
jgi:16S rRNA A1518/A1519 N6-dimethyltransferase RsmA/KsgA/DIM1 with predicted DNA glycosylase/AP lyase activity